MSLVFAAITPHPPILIPQIGKENLKKISTTQKSFNKLKQIIKETEVESILIISPHGHIQTSSFNMNLSPNFNSHFEDFGDFATKRNWKGDVGLAYKIRERLETKAPLQLMTDPILDHGSSVPLCLLTEEKDNIKIMPLYFSGLDLDAHFKFGQLLRRELVYNNEKIGVIASGDLSHRLTEDAPAGYSPKSKKFDKKMIDFLTQNKTEEIINIDEKLSYEAGECGLRSIAILQGILHEIKHTPQLLSYEAPFGVGYLTMNFKL